MPAALRRAALRCGQLTVFGRILAAKPGINVYDIRKQCEGPLCYDFSDADAFLNSAGVRKALGVGDTSWQECNMLVNAAFYGAWCAGVIEWMRAVRTCELLWWARAGGARHSTALKSAASVMLHATGVQ